jgi:type II secretory pathway component PulF
MWWRLRTLFGVPIPDWYLGLFCEQCSALLHAGVSIPESLRKAAAFTDPELQEIVAKIIPPISLGSPLSEALRPYARRLPPITLPILEVGEATGGMDGALKRLADAFLKQASFEGRYKFQVYNPWMTMVIIALQSVVAYTSEITDRYTSTFATVLHVVFVVLRSLLSLICFYILGRITFSYFNQRPRPRYFIDTLKLALPYVSTVSRSIATVRWARSFVTLWEAGIPISQAIEIAARGALNAHYERILLKVAADTRRGRSLAASFEDTGLLPPVLLMVMTVGEETGNFGQSLGMFLDRLEEDALDTGVKAMMAVSIMSQMATTLALGIFAALSLGHSPWSSSRVDDSAL